MEQNFNNKTGYIEIHESYEGELTVTLVDPDKVRPEDASGYVLFREDKEEEGNPFYCGEHSEDDSPVNFDTAEEADGARLLLPDPDAWEVMALVMGDVIEGDELEAEPEEEVAASE
jgi:hypothetical protein